MSRSPVLPRSETATQKLAKVSAAFVIGLVTMFGSALVYSNLEQRKEWVPATQSTQPRQPMSVAESPVPAVVAASRLPESSISEEDQRQNTTSSPTAGTPDSATRNGTVPGRPAESRRSTRLPTFDEHEAENSLPVPARASVPKPDSASSAKPLSSVPPVGDDGLLVPFGSHVNVPPPQLPSMLPVESKDTLGLEHHSRTEPPARQAEPVVSAPAPKVVVAPATTSVEVQISETLSSDHNRPGDTFRATLAAPLIIDGYLLAEAGASVRGRVETAQKAALLGGQSELSVTVTEIDTREGQHTRVATGWRKVKGTRVTLTNTAKMATGAAMGAVVGAVQGAAKGAGLSNAAFEEGHAGSGFMPGTRTAVIPAGAQLTFILVAPLTATGTPLR